MDGLTRYSSPNSLMFIVRLLVRIKFPRAFAAACTMLGSELRSSTVLNALANCNGTHKSGVSFQTANQYSADACLDNLRFHRVSEDIYQVLHCLCDKYKFSTAVRRPILRTYHYASDFLVDIRAVDHRQHLGVQRVQKAVPRLRGHVVDLSLDVLLQVACHLLPLIALLRPQLGRCEKVRHCEDWLAAAGLAGSIRQATLRTNRVNKASELPCRPDLNFSRCTGGGEEAPSPYRPPKQPAELGGRRT